MKFLLDPNVTWELIPRLRRLGHEATAIAHLKNGPREDADLLALARREGAILVTCDADFTDAARFPPREIGGIVTVASGQYTKDRQIELVERFVAGGAFEKVKGALVALYADGTMDVRS